MNVPLLYETDHPVLELASYEKYFIDLGQGWKLFKEGKYKTAYCHIHLSSKSTKFPARYLLGLYYEYGLKGDGIDLLMASKLYSSTYASSNNTFLKNRSERAIYRVLRKFN